jgi:hypothetical protein
MTRNLLLLLGFIFLFTACRKENPGTQKSFTYKGTEYQTPNAYYGVENDGIELTISNFEYNPLTSEYSGSGSGLDFVKIKSATTSKLPVGTFRTPESWGDTLSAYLGIAVMNVDTLYSGNYVPRYFKSGMISIAESSKGYLITYEVITDENQAIKGSYEGAVIRN